MQSRERGTRAAVHKPLGGWQTGFLGVNKGEFTDEDAATFTMVNGWSRFRPQRPTFTAPSRLSAWTKLGRGSGNLRGGIPGLATAETMRTAGEADGVAGTRFAKRYGYS